MTKYEVEFDNGALVEVEIDPDIFTEEYLDSFARYFYPSFKTAEDHIRYIASLAADPEMARLNFWEGYGEVSGSRYRKEVEINDGDGVVGTARAYVKYEPDDDHWMGTVRQI